MVEVLGHGLLLYHLLQLNILCVDSSREALFLSLGVNYVHSHGTWLVFFWENDKMWPFIGRIVGTGHVSICCVIAYQQFFSSWKKEKVLFQVKEPGHLYTQDLLYTAHPVSSMIWKFWCSFGSRHERKHKGHDREVVDFHEDIFRTVNSVSSLSLLKSVSVSLLFPELLPYEDTDCFLWGGAVTGNRKGVHRSI